MIHVEYAAPQAILKPDTLEAWIQRELERHLASVRHASSAHVSVSVKIEECIIQVNYGRVVWHVFGSINGKAVDWRIDHSDKPARPYDGEGADRAVKTAFANAATFVKRLVIPSPAAVALGSRRTSGRTLRALEDCMAEARIMINRALDRPDTGGKELWLAGKRRAVYAAVIAAVAAIIVLIVRREYVYDGFRATIGAFLFIPVGTWAGLCSWRLMTLPSQFYLSDRAGRGLVKLMGVKKPGAIRVVAAGMLLISACLFAAACYWLLWE